MTSTGGYLLVTADELEPHRDADGFLRLALTAEVNGQVVGEDLLPRRRQRRLLRRAVGPARRGDPAAAEARRHGLPHRRGIGGTITVVSGVEPVPLQAGRRRSRERP
ncbi:hypothetical protein ACIBBD_28090 [Streptomyces sp. NPDC051315]|uniref:hypothetical protein n=1 Tax=Streptomyces sp. NPDC051315 TaxID=3365650 RepID=UPI00379160E1